MTLVLRSYQQEAVNSVFSYYENGGAGNPIIALPTGTGKSLVLGEMIRLIFKYYPGQRVIALTHVQELIEQNAKELLKIWPFAPLGIFSAALGRKESINPIVYGGVASVKNCIDLFGHRDLMFIDECHLLSPNDNSMYQNIIRNLRVINPKLKVIGLTATMFRLGQGLLTQDGLFTDCVYNLCNIEGFARLIIGEYMSPPIPQVTRTELDVSGVKIHAGEYVLNQLQAAVDRPDITQAALRELCDRARDRVAWLIFASGIEHADHCAETLDLLGIPAAAVHSRISPEQRSDRIAQFKAGKLRALTNNNILTTGFDAPQIDCIGMLRPTVSPSLWVQMIGRGTRIYPGKKNCLVLDFAGNSRRLGPIDDPAIPNPKVKGDGDMPIKICEACGTYNHTRVRFCVNCGAEFEFKQKISAKAGTDNLLSGGSPKVETFDVNHVTYGTHISKAGNHTIRIGYYCGENRFNEYLNFDGASFGKHHAHEFWRQRSDVRPPLDNDAAIYLMRAGKLRQPRRIKVWTNQRWPKVVGAEW